MTAPAYPAEPPHLVKNWLTEADEHVVINVLDAGVDPNLRHYMGGLPLAYAAQLGRADAVKLLLDYGADPSLTDEKGKTALDYALERAQKGSTELPLLRTFPLSNVNSTFTLQLQFGIMQS